MPKLLNRATLRVKIVILVVTLSCTVALVLAAQHYRQMRAWLKAASLERLELTGEIYAEGIAVRFDTLLADAARNANFPPVPGILRASAAADGIDPLDGSSLQDWETRLGEIFSTFLDTHPTYTQLRFISRADGWSEVVRVNRGPLGAVIVPEEELQAKGHRPYLDGVARNGLRDSYFSDVGYNIDHGKSDGVVTIRVIHPVLDSAGEVFGAIVINADFEALLNEGAPRLANGVTVSVVDQDGAYMTFDGGDEPAPLVFQDSPHWAPIPEWEIARDWGFAPRAALRGDIAYVSVPVVRAGGRSPFAMNVVTRTRTEDLFAPAQVQLQNDALLALALALGTGLLALLFGRRITEPLNALHRAVSDRATRTEPIDFESDALDEVGALARGFADLTNDLIRESARINAILDNASDGIITIDCDGLITDVNRAAAEMFGYAPWDLLGAPLTNLMPRPDAEMHQSYVEKVTGARRRPQMAPNRVVWGLREDGSEFPVDVSIGRAVYDGRVHFVGVVHDVSLKHEMTRQRDLLIASLQRSNAELDQFAYVASHDLKAPLRVIDNASRWLAEDLEDHLTEDTRESLDLMRNRVQRMERLLDDLLAHSRIGRVDIPDTLVSGGELVADLSELVTVPEGFELEFAPEFERIRVPRSPLETVLLNLVTNAIKHHDCDRGRVSVGVEERPGEFVFTIADDGPGIPAEFHERVFEVFQTLRPRDEVESSGMGLAMVRKYVDLAGGGIEIRSNGERGTVFVVTWPRARVQAEERAA